MNKETGLAEKSTAVTRKHLVLVTMTVLVMVTSAWVWLTPVPTFEQARSATQSSESVLLDRDGQVLQRLRLDKHRRMLAWVPLQEISPTLLQAILVAEDKRFYSHSGIDFLAAASALVDNLHRSRARGASTITMQLAKLMNTPNNGTSHNSWLAKLNQSRFALALELCWSKQQILEAYLNRVTFRGELVGIDAAARGMLAKGPNGLDNIDAAILASLIRSPGASRSRLAKRACATLKAMHVSASSKQDNCMQVTLRTALLPGRPFPIPGMDDAPHLARHLLTSHGAQFKSSIAASVQRFARDTLRTHLAQLADQNVEDGAVVVLDNLSGEVLAYVGSSGDLSGAAEVDGVAALRQPGSTLKPFLYALAMDQGWLNASSVLDDSPLALTTPSGLYIPQDYDRHFQGAVSVRTALGASLNVPAIRTLTLVGVDPFLDKLRGLGLTSLTRDAEHYGYGLALGGAETTLLQLTNAYRALANGGLWQPVSFMPATLKQPKSSSERKQVFSPQASFIIGDILSDPGARTITFGLSSPLSTRTWAAVKTGTSKAMRDNWAIGYTDRYTVGVWVGNFSGAPMWDVSGITGAAPVWRDIIEHLHSTHHSRQPEPPKGVLHQQVRYQPAIESPRQDWVIDSSGAKAVSHQTININVTPASAMLIAPPDSAIIAPDPDIPQSRQALLLQSGGSGKSCMLLDNRKVAACGKTKALMSLPLPGKHQLTLTDTNGKLLDRHTFEVRGLNLPIQAYGRAD